MDNLHHHQPLLTPPPASNIHGPATHSNLRLRDAYDAHVLFQAVREGHFQLIRRRLNGPEQQGVAPGHVYVWADREGALERWTDGHNWSPSRVRGPFLMYDEMPEPPDASFLRRKRPTAAPGEKIKHPRKKRLPPLPGGLSKQTYSATMMGHGQPVQKWHLTAYFTDSAVSSLPTIEEDPILRATMVPENTFVGSMSGRRKSKSKGQQRGVSESNIDSAEVILGTSPLQEYSTNASLPLGPPGHSSENWIFTEEPEEHSYDDDDHNDGGGSGESAGTVRAEHGAPSDFQRPEPFTSSIVDQLHLPIPCTLLVPMRPPQSTDLSGWARPLLQSFSHQGIDEERRDSWSAQSSGSPTSTSASMSADSFYPYASSASSTPPYPPSQLSDAPGATQSSLIGSILTSSIFPWVDVTASKPYSGYTSSPTSSHFNYPSSRDGHVFPASPTQSTGAAASHSISPRLQITHANQNLPSTTSRQASFSGHPSGPLPHFGPSALSNYSIAAASIQPDGGYYTQRRHLPQYREQTMSGALSNRHPASIPSSIPSGQATFAFSTSSNQPLQPQYIRQRASTISTMGRQQQSFSSARWPPEASSQHAGTEYAHWVQNPLSLDPFKNRADLYQRPAHSSLPNSPAMMNIPPPHRHSLSSYGSYNVSPQYGGRPTDVFDSVLAHSQMSDTPESHARSEALSRQEHRPHYWGPP